MVKIFSSFLTFGEKRNTFGVSNNTFGVSKNNKEVYKEQGYESRLLSRTTEDAATVTSVLIPWNTCGMTQSTVLGVPTLTYLPYCFFNYLSPLMSIFIAATGWRIYRKVLSE